MKRDYQDAIENKVYEYRVLRRMSQQDLADAVGVSKQTIFVMEKGNYTPSLIIAFRIANFFDVGIEEVFHYRKEEENV